MTLFLLQFLPQEEGRIRFKPATGTIPASFAYDYFIKDPLGNVRMVLTDEQKTDAYPPASMETAQAATEEALYANVNTTRVAKPAGYPTDTYTNPNDNVAKTNGNGNKIGPAIVLKVMAGDKFNLRVNSWYKTNGATPGTPVSPLNDLLSALAGGIAGTGSAHGVTATEIINSGVLTSGVTNFLNSQTYNSSKPKAFVNWILLDEQFKYYAGGVEQVGANEEFKTHIRADEAINKSGYLYIYVSNETPNIDVFFDNLQVTHTRGAILEESHYYPFGLTMGGISSMAAGGMVNKKQFNGIEHTTDLDLNQYDAFYRTLDPQIGRFLQIDPKLDSMFAWSPYTAMYDNPIRFIDPLGDSSKPADKKQAYIPPPKTGLPGFPEGGNGSYNQKSGRWRWKLRDGRILEWDKQHGEVEMYDKSGKKHLGSFDPETGEQIKEGVKGRTTQKIAATAGLAGAASMVPSALSFFINSTKITYTLATTPTPVPPNVAGRAAVTATGATGAAAVIVETIAGLAPVFAF